MHTKRECPHGHSLFAADEMSKAPKRILAEQVSKVCVLPPANFFRSNATRLRSPQVFRQISTRSLAQRGIRVELARNFYKCASTASVISVVPTFVQPLLSM